MALIAYDVPYPAPLYATRPVSAVFGVALVLSPAPSAASFARLELALRPGVDTPSSAAPALEALRQTTPAARSLPLLAALAGGERGGGDAGLSVRHGPELSITPRPFGGLAGATGMTRLGRDEILTLIPHGGAMCLLDEVLDWDAAAIHCLSHRYRAPDNPLRRADGTLGSACGIEIAAQAMAVHGRLTAPAEGTPVPGYLVSLRDVRLASPRLDDGGRPADHPRDAADGRCARRNLRFFRHRPGDRHAERPRHRFVRSRT